MPLLFCRFAGVDRVRFVIGLCLCPAVAAVSGCASLRGAADRAQVAAELHNRTGAEVRPDLGAPELPPTVSLDNGLTEEEAVSVALWNNPIFQADLADLGVARADLVQAGLLRNPVLTLLLPWGPKQLEATAKWPVDALWQRPRRLAAARVALEAVADRLVAHGLDLIAETKVAFVDLLTALQRSELVAETVAVAQRIRDIARARFKAGDISELEASVAEVDSDRVEQDARRATLDVTLARGALHQLLGLGTHVPASALAPAETPDAATTPCGDLATLQRDAFAWRPDLRAAELDIEAAARRLGWERSRVVSLIGILDANAHGPEGFELGPGVEADLGLFDRNQAGVSRAGAELDRARARYGVVQQRILRELHDAYAQLQQSQQEMAAWRDQIRPRLERQTDQMQRAYEAGDVSYLNVLDASQRLNEGRRRETDARAVMRRAIIRLEQRVGRACTLN